jgi:hypothetical protein
MELIRLGGDGVGALSGQSFSHTVSYDVKEAGICILCRLLDLTECWTK